MFHHHYLGNHCGMVKIWIVAALAAALSFALPAHAGIVKIQDVKSCSVDGLDTSTDSVTGGVHCDNGSPFSLSGILDGSIGLLVGDSQTPSWNIVNDTGADVTTLSLYYTGLLAPNADIDLQVSGDYFKKCSTDDGTNFRTDDNCGSGDKTVKPEDGGQLPVLLTWSTETGGTGIALDQAFNLGTASFAHSGQDAGCFSGTPTCEPSAVPTPASLGLLLLGLLALTLRKLARSAE